MKEGYVLDPLWITKGSNGLDYEYLSYILLAADKKWREKLGEDDLSGFYEVIFHMLNLNSLAISGTMYDSNMRPVFENETLDEIRQKLRVIYDAPREIIDIFRYTSSTFIDVLLDHLDVILDAYTGCKLYYSNRALHRENEIFIIVSNFEDKSYDVWRLRFDKRLKHNWSLDYHQTFSLSENVKDNEITSVIRSSNNPNLAKFDSHRNAILTICNEESDNKRTAESVAFTLLFNRMILKQEANFHPSILFQLKDLLNERTVPFTLDDWV